MLLLTENAQKTVGRCIKCSEAPVGGLRISVTGGGRSGMQYGIALEDASKADDTVVELGALKVFIDPDGAPLLDGGGFKFDNPNANAGCGCGNSFSA
jgi:iron-sulfur cluster assembly accessory protein